MPLSRFRVLAVRRQYASVDDDVEAVRICLSTSVIASHLQVTVTCSELTAIDSRLRSFTVLHTAEPLVVVLVCFPAILHRHLCVWHSLAQVDVHLQVAPDGIDALSPYAHCVTRVTRARTCCAARALRNLPVNTNAYQSQ